MKNIHLYVCPQCGIIGSLAECEADVLGKYTYVKCTMMLNHTAFGVYNKCTYNNLREMTRNYNLDQLILSA